MANEITRLLPFRQYDENDVVNFYSLDAETGEAGSVVRVSAANLDEEPVKYVERGDSNSYQNTLGHGLSLYPEVPYKVTKMTGTGTNLRPLGILLRDVRAKDENGENLLYYPEKKDELQCVVSGESVPIATRGLFTVNVNALKNGVVPALNSIAICSTNGTLTGVARDSASSNQEKVHVGKFIATGTRESNNTTDAFAGAYAILKLEL
jgi:hypothetical protein|tara:strand:+ start:444 stop:1067 length:624 start_codon:yes stop_codon:yes gene_type:complete